MGKITRLGELISDLRGCMVANGQSKEVIIKISASSCND